MNALLSDEGNVGVSVFYHKEEGWINVLTCRVDRDIQPISIEVYPYTDALLAQWINRSKFTSKVYVFECNRLNKVETNVSFDAPLVSHLSPNQRFLL